MIATISTYLDTRADRVWKAVKRSATLIYVMRGLMGVVPTSPFPEEWQEGQVISMRLVFCHVLPAWMHELHIVRLDENRHELYTHERGGPVSTWNHRIRVTPAPRNRCHYTDEIEIQAGLFTWPVWLFAHLLYRYRQLRWRSLARSLP